MRGSLLTAEIFEAARLGDRRAILALVEQAGPDVKRYARFACRSPSDAEDAAQETMLSLYQQVGSIRSIQTIRIWLFTVVKRHCLRLARRAMRMLPYKSTIPEPSQAALQDLHVALAHAIEALPVDYRAILLACDLQGMSLQEAASLLDITVFAAKARLGRARTTLRAALT